VAGPHAAAAAHAAASPESAAEAARYARQTARSVLRHSSNSRRLIDPRKEMAVPRFRPAEVVLGNQLGRGGFSNVYEIVRFDLQQGSSRKKDRPNLLGEEGEEGDMIGVPVGGALSDSHQVLMERRRSSRRRSSRNSQSSRGSRGSRDRDEDCVHEEDGGPNGTNDCDDVDANTESNDNNGDNGDAPPEVSSSSSPSSDDDSSDDEIPVDQLDRICRRVSRTSFVSAAKSSKSSDDSDDAGEIVHPTLRRGESTSRFSSYHTTARQFVAQHCIRDAKSKNEPSTPRYALKRLRPDVMGDADLYRMGAADLVVEARFLACLEHPNIVKIRGMAQGDCDAFASGVEGDYFLVLDRLSESLTQRLEKWKKAVRLSRGKISGRLVDRRGARWNQHLAQRLECAFEIANALKYLHGKNIIFRDLKPDNVGFDCRGDVKIFDFGLAKEMRDDERVEDSTLPAARRRKKGRMFTDVYEMSAPCGSYRYMAPEVMLAQPYNFSADTYSFAVLLYEISMLKKPYANMGRDELIERVTVEKCRPELLAEGRKALPPSLRTYLSLAWSDNLRYRPTMEATAGTLFRCLETLKGAGSDNAKRPSGYDRRRSTFVLRGASGRNLMANLSSSNRNLMGSMFKRRPSSDSNSSDSN